MSPNEDNESTHAVASPPENEIAPKVSPTSPPAAYNGFAQSLVNNDFRTSLQDVDGKLEKIATDDRNNQPRLFRWMDHEMLVADYLTDTSSPEAEPSSNSERLRDRSSATTELSELSRDHTWQSSKTTGPKPRAQFGAILADEQLATIKVQRTATTLKDSSGKLQEAEEANKTIGALSRKRKRPNDQILKPPCDPSIPVLGGTHTKQSYEKRRRVSRPSTALYQ